MRNTELFDLIADTIEKRPESYNQSSWGCGTSFCVAGHAAALSGCKPTAFDWEYILPPENDDTGLEGDDEGEIYVETWAAKKLGLSTDDCELFDCSWEPPEGMTVPEALRAIGRGADIE